MTASAIVSTGPIEDGCVHLRIVSEKEELTLPVRKATQEHRNYILATWVRSCVASAKHGPVDVETVTSNEGKLAEELWKNTIVVTSPQDSYTVLAWATGRAYPIPTLDYVYVVPELRRKGVATALTHYVAGHNYDCGRKWPFKKGCPSGYRPNPYILGTLPSGVQNASST